MTTIIVTDGRGRTTLGAKDTTFKVTQLEDGALLLEPAQILTRAELALLSAPGLKEQVEASLVAGGQGVTYRRRSRRADA